MIVKTRFLMLAVLLLLVVAALLAVEQDDVTVQYWHTMSDPETA